MKSVRVPEIDRGLDLLEEGEGYSWEYGMNSTSDYFDSFGNPPEYFRADINGDASTEELIEMIRRESEGRFGGLKYEYDEENDVLTLRAHMQPASGGNRNGRLSTEEGVVMEAATDEWMPDFISGPGHEMVVELAKTLTEESE